MTHCCEVTPLTHLKQVTVLPRGSSGVVLDHTRWGLLPVKWVVQVGYSLCRQMQRIACVHVTNTIWLQPQSFLLSPATLVVLQYPTWPYMPDYKSPSLTG
jgi:hypothetical protein